VREALRLLASQNLIVTTRGVAGGSFVVHPSPDQLIDTLTTGVHLLQTSQLVSATHILEARLFVERPVAALVAERRTEQDLAALRESLFDPLTSTYEVMVEVHSAFHETMADACGNPLLSLIAKPLHRIANVREALLDRFRRDFWIQVDADHRAILAAVVDRRPDEAEAATARHIENLGLALDTTVETTVETPDEASAGLPARRPATVTPTVAPDELAVSAAGGA
jgi:GntR family transcriptional regulator, transcriptional repressor for pyruvate dehydrogenase complex